MGYDFLVFFYLKSLVSLFSFLKSDLFFSKMVLFHIYPRFIFILSLFFPCCLSSICYGVFCYRPVAICIVADLLRWVVVLSIISFFVVFVLAIEMTKFDPIKSSNTVNLEF